MNVFVISSLVILYNFLLIFGRCSRKSVVCGEFVIGLYWYIVKNLIIASLSLRYFECNEKTKQILYYAYLRCSIPELLSFISVYLSIAVQYRYYDARCCTLQLISVGTWSH